VEPTIANTRLTMSSCRQVLGPSAMEIGVADEVGGARVGLTHFSLTCSAARPFRGRREQQMRPEIPPVPA
jgi:hypothetical protein